MKSSLLCAKKESEDQSEAFMIFFVRLLIFWLTNNNLNRFNAGETMADHSPTDNDGEEAKRQENEVPVEEAHGGTDGETPATERQWPNMFEETSDMLAVSILTYGIAEFRQQVREGKITMKQGNLDLPKKFDEASRLIAIHLEDIKRVAAPASFDLYMTGLNAIIDAKELELQKDASADDGKIIVFDDEHAEQELVYSIDVNPTGRRVTISFRGSVTVRDAMIDIKLRLVQIPNPVEPGTTVRIHGGFRDYLYGKATQFPHRTLEKGEGRKIDTIIDRVLEVMDEYPGYYVTVTGHSLGGSLATLLAFELGALDDDRIQGPVSCFSFASPRVGNLTFANAFQSLERARKLRCLRVYNQNDIFPKIPNVDTRNLFGCTCIGSDLIYRHVGVSLKLMQDGGYKVVYPLHYQHPVKRTIGDLFGKIHTSRSSVRRILCRENLARNHSCMEYWTRLHLNEQALQKMHLHHQYKQVAGREFELEEDW